MNNVRAELKITGRVQGVFYRQSTMETASGLGLTGWVRNCPDGSVEAIFEGNKQAVDLAIEWCREGPPAAKVIDIKIAWTDATGDFETFDVRRFR